MKTSISDLAHSCVGLSGVCVAESVMSVGKFNVPIKQAGKILVTSVFC